MRPAWESYLSEEEATELTRICMHAHLLRKELHSLAKQIDRIRSRCMLRKRRDQTR